MALLLSPAPRAKAPSTLSAAMKLTTKAFSATHPIPERFTADGANVSPPRGTHRYFFRLYALDTKLDLPANADRATLDEAVASHALDRSELLGRYGRE